MCLKETQENTKRKTTKDKQHNKIIKNTNKTTRGDQH